MSENIYIQLIYQRLTDGLSPSDQQILDAWLALSEDNRLTAQSVELAWQASGTIQPDVELDLDAEFADLEALMKTETATPVVEKPRTAKVRQLSTVKSIRPWLSIAAGLFLLIAAGFLYSRFFMDAPIVWVEQQSQKNVKTIQLADHSTVQLNANSTLKYPEDFTRKQRRVYLDGEAFFDVERNEEKPFIIETKHEIIQVLGTSFEVDASNDQNLVYVEVKTGKVQVGFKQGGKKVLLLQGQRAIIDRKTHTMTMKRTTHFNNLAWATRQLRFEETPLLETLESIKDAYQIDFLLENKELEQCSFTANFDKATLKEIFEIVATTFALEIAETEKGLYELKGGSCH